MVAKPIKDAVKALKEIIDQNGLNYLADEPYRVYEKLLESGRADRKTAAVLLHAPLFLTKQPDKRPPFESNYLVDEHEAVVDRLTWDVAQKKLMKRREDIDSGVRYHDGRTHFFYGKVFCGEYGVWGQIQLRKC